MKSGPSQRSLTWNSFLEDHFSSSPSSCLRTAQGQAGQSTRDTVGRGRRRDRPARSRHPRRAPLAAKAREKGGISTARNSHAQLLRPFVHGARQGYAAHGRKAYATDEHHFNNHRRPAPPALESGSSQPPFLGRTPSPLKTQAHPRYTSHLLIYNNGCFLQGPAFFFIHL